MGTRTPTSAGRPRPPLWWRLSGSPLATIAILVGLALMARSPRTATFSRNWPTAAPLRADGYPDRPMGSVVRAVGGAEKLLWDTELTGGEHVVALVYYNFRDMTPGVPLSVQMEEITVLHADPSPTFPARARGLYLQRLSTHPERYWRGVAARLGAGDITGESFNARRLIRAVLFLFLTAALVRSLAWTIPIVVRLATLLESAPPVSEQERRRRKLASGLCPGCGYDIRGLPKPVCPECGESLRA